MNLELINRTLEITENPGLDTLDPRFSDITILAQNGEYREAAAQAEEVLSENTFDIRIIGYFLYGMFLDEGVGALEAVFRCLSRLLQENWQAVGPVKKREKHAKTSLNWLMKMLHKKMQHEEEKKENDWNLWVEQVSSEQVQEALDAAQELRHSLVMTLENDAGPVVDGLMKVKDWLSAFQKMVYREPGSEEEPGEEQSKGAEAKARIGGNGERMSGEAGGLMSALTFDAGTGVEGSYHLQVLLRKLEAFERLIQGGKLPLAALVADDINNTIAHFDPKVFFPRLFSRFSLLFALHINELASCGAYKGTAAWQALEELYKVDMDAFVGFNIEGLNWDAVREAGGGMNRSGGVDSNDPGEYEEAGDKQGNDWR